jgi:hypothetical protein
MRWSLVYDIERLTFVYFGYIIRRSEVSAISF